MISVKGLGLRVLGVIKLKVRGLKRVENRL
jgi:hypothetical protein